MRHLRRWIDYDEHAAARPAQGSRGEEDRLPPMRVPQRHRAGFCSLHDLSDAGFSAVLKALSVADAAHHTGARQLALAVQGAVPDLGEQVATAMVDAVLSVQTGRMIHEDSLTEFAQALAASDDLALPPEASERLSSRIVAMAQAPVVAITAKARDVTTEHDRLFHSARVLTDIRPVFGDNPDQPPFGAVIRPCFAHRRFQEWPPPRLLRNFG